MESAEQRAKPMLLTGVAALHLTRCGLRGTFSRDLTGRGATMRNDMTMAGWLRLGALAAAAIWIGSAPAQAANFLERNFYLSGPRYDGDLPPCESALSRIQSRFAGKEGKFWNSALEITGFDNVREIAYRPWEPNSIPRRYCTATALISDGKPRTVNFSLVEDGGLAGYGTGVEFCVVGLDRNWAYNPACKAALP